MFIKPYEKEKKKKSRRKEYELRWAEDINGNVRVAVSPQPWVTQIISWRRIAFRCCNVVFAVDILA